MSPFPQDQGKQQYNHASDGGTVNANQGRDQYVNSNVTNRTTNNFKLARSWAGFVTVLVMLAVDVAFYFYGMTAYTGHPDDSGDLWRSGIFLVLVAITGTVTRRWLRRA